jgi:hypothetical protein
MICRYRFGVRLQILPVRIFLLAYSFIFSDILHKKHPEAICTSFYSSHAQCNFGEMRIIFTWA